MKEDKDVLNSKDRPVIQQPKTENAKVKEVLEAVWDIQRIREKMNHSKMTRLDLLKQQFTSSCIGSMVAISAGDIGEELH